MKMQPGDYIETSDIPDHETLNRIREAVRAWGYRVSDRYGTWTRTRRAPYLVLDKDGDLTTSGFPKLTSRRFRPEDLLNTQRHYPGAEWLQALADAAKHSERPWGAFEFFQKGFGWIAPKSLDQFLYALNAGLDCRRYQPTRTVAGVTFPEPMREAPEKGTGYYCVSLEDADGVDYLIWDGDKIDKSLLKHGMAQATEEGARLQSKALVLASGGRWPEDE